MNRRTQEHDQTTGSQKRRTGSGTPRQGTASGQGNLPLFEVPPGSPRQQYRPAQPNIPNDKSQRDHLKRLARRHVAQAKLVPPLTLDELKDQSERVCKLADLESIYRSFAAVVVNNEAWRDTLARIPYDRRLLLLPQCLRAQGRCQAPIDELGLVCQDCGSCAIHYLQTEAERLGYAVLVAEGSTVVTEMIRTGRIDAVVGVSCLSVLEQCFPHMEARAVPGVAIPLLQDGCANTSVDLDWVWEAVHLSSAALRRHLDLDALKGDVQSWFTTEALAAVIGAPKGETETIAHQWLARAGKRWRPYLAVCVYRSLEPDAGDGAAALTDDLKKLAVAVECFHKASLIHDDIEDDDDERYGQQALHVEHGMPVALNVGDFLLGEGYRLIGELEVDAETRAAMLHTAAVGHLTLSRGQGAELCWARQPRPLSPLEVLDIFRQKTAPAFEVALRLGAFYAGAHQDVHDVLARYSEALGIAYQIRDDLEDFAGAGDSHDLRDLRPSVVLAIADQRAEDDTETELTSSLWKRTCDYDQVADDFASLIARRGVVQTVENLLETYTAQASRSLHPLSNATLKGLLRRVIGRIFGDKQVGGYCRELEARHAAGRSVGTGPAA